jgi:hypothetical protein
MPFHKNVFVNCPFDSDYLSLLRPLLLLVHFMAATYDDLTTSHGRSPADAANLPIDELLPEMKAWVGNNSLS